MKHKLLFLFCLTFLFSPLRVFGLDLLNADLETWGGALPQNWSSSSQYNVPFFHETGASCSTVGNCGYVEETEPFSDSAFFFSNWQNFYGSTDETYIGFNYKRLTSNSYTGELKFCNMFLSTTNSTQLINDPDNNYFWSFVSQDWLDGNNLGSFSDGMRCVTATSTDWQSWIDLDEPAPVTSPVNASYYTLFISASNDLSPTTTELTPYFDDFFVSSTGNPTSTTSTIPLLTSTSTPLLDFYIENYMPTLYYIIGLLWTIALFRVFMDIYTDFKKWYKGRIL